MKDKIKTIIIGAGSIGALKDDKYDKPGGGQILTHAHAIAEHHDFELIGIYDVDKEKAEKASKKWNVDFMNINSISEIPYADVFVIATPTEFHTSTVEALFDVHPDIKAIILEKPAGLSSHEAKRLNKYGDKIIVNYTRRYDTRIQMLRTDLVTGYYGKIYSAVLYYVRGLLRDGCHGIDLMQYFFGNIRNTILLKKGEADYADYDLTDSIFIDFEKNISGYLIGLDGRNYDVFEMIIHTEKGEIKLTDHSKYIEYKFSETEKTYGNYKTLSERIKKEETYWMSRLFSLYNHVSDFITEDIFIECDILDAYRVHRVIEEVRSVSD